MPRFVFVTFAGDRVELEAPVGTSAMAAAFTNGIDGISAECGGSLACGTCHVFVEPSQLGALTATSDAERDLLSMTAVAARENSRLSCQILASQETDGLVMYMPEMQ